MITFGSYKEANTVQSFGNTRNKEIVSSKVYGKNSYVVFSISIFLRDQYQCVLEYLRVFQERFHKELGISYR